MNQIVWTDDFSLGNSVFDEQHRQLIELINATTAGLEQGAGGVDVLSLLRRLQDYARYHFEAEEAFMAEINFPEQAEHLTQHQYFIQRIMELDARLFSQEEGILNELADFLSFWLLDHIVMIDFKYADFAGTRTEQVLMT